MVLALLEQRASLGSGCVQQHLTAVFELQVSTGKGIISVNPPSRVFTLRVKEYLWKLIININ